MNHIRFITLFRRKHKIMRTIYLIRGLLEEGNLIEWNFSQMKPTNAVNVCIEELEGGWLKVTSQNIPELLVYFGSGEAELVKKLPKIISSFTKRELTRKKTRLASDDFEPVRISG